jgi:ABC-2 type transport system ATP-binding protein
MSVRVESLSKSYGSQRAVSDVSFVVGKGEIVGFIGPNGSGKSTTMKCICGILPADEGNILVDGIDVNESPLSVKMKLGYLPEHNPLPLDMYVKEYLLHVDAFYNNRIERNQRVINMLELTGLGREQNKKISQLSKGYRQRVGLAQALIHNPSVLILDEPTTGLDPNQIVEIRNLISGLSEEKTVLLSTHILQEVEAICDRVLIINQGSIVADDTSQQIKSTGKDDLQIIYLEFNSMVDRNILEQLPVIKEIHQINEKEFLVAGSKDSDLREQVFNLAAQNGLTLLTIQKKEESLEEAFRKLTSSN